MRKFRECLFDILYNTVQGLISMNRTHENLKEKRMCFTSNPYNWIISSELFTYEVLLNSKSSTNDIEKKGKRDEEEKALTRPIWSLSSSSPSPRTSDGQSSLADKCCSPLQIHEAAVELLGLQGWLGPGPHSQFFIQLTPL